MKLEETIITKPEYVREVHSLEIPCDVIYDKNEPNEITISTNLGKMGLVSQGNSIEDAKVKIKDAFDASISFYERQSELLRKRAIWISNFRKDEGGFHFWFTIIGLGLTINYFSKREIPIVDKNNKPIKFIGINRAGGLVIKNLLVFKMNAWKKNNKQKK